ncbi:hypothetical protein GH714_007631 [Hevea brasiliensis]|uniref:NADH dehydrogenase [ubiquinone] 1 alpha subcomplex subunit 12 n=1 Tax=Hevea brasiliensis TaxID=3981 RepID=A0A6A6KA85_HEVBR|nr:hypothetical protein GH714_007631 [Hevea brasiliensis]
MSYRDGFVRSGTNFGVSEGQVLQALNIYRSIRFFRVASDLEMGFIFVRKISGGRKGRKEKGRSVVEVQIEKSERVFILVAFGWRENKGGKRRVEKTRVLKWEMIELEARRELTRQNVAREKPDEESDAMDKVRKREAEAENAKEEPVPASSEPSGSGATFRPGTWQPPT